MRSIATLTYHRHDNYGAVLQCYALQEVLKDMGCIVNVLDYICEGSLRPYTLTAIKSRGLVPCIFSTLGILARLPRRKAFQRFRKEKLDLSKSYTKRTIASAEKEYDCFIVGSDNVWNPEITGFDKTYFLDFVKDSNKKNSYAASMGVGTVPARYKEDIKRLLSDFHIITTREEKAAISISELLSRPVESVLDPTLLLSPERWSELSVVRPKKRPYILAYQMLPSKEFVQFVNMQAKRLGCEAIFIPFAQGWKAYNAHFDTRLGPEEWLGLFKDADYVVTDSFHGCVFSILFHKKFAIKVSQLGDRIFNLLTLTGLTHRIVEDLAHFNIEEDIQYGDVDCKLRSAKERSMEILRTIALN